MSSSTSAIIFVWISEEDSLDGGKWANRYAINIRGPMGRRNIPITSLLCTTVFGPPERRETSQRSLNRLPSGSLSHHLSDKPPSFVFKSVVMSGQSSRPPLVCLTVARLSKTGSGLHPYKPHTGDKLVKARGTFRVSETALTAKYKNIYISQKKKGKRNAYMRFFFLVLQYFELA